MPGSGKTTFSSLLSKEFSLPAIDMDDYIEEKLGKSIPEIFENGEECFRDVESEACEDLSKREGIVIVAGGRTIKHLYTLHKERYHLYLKYGEYRVDNSGIIENTLGEMIKITRENLDGP